VLHSFSTVTAFRLPTFISFHCLAITSFLLLSDCRVRYSDRFPAIITLFSPVTAFQQPASSTIEWLPSFQLLMLRARSSDRLPPITTFISTNITALQRPHSFHYELPPTARLCQSTSFDSYPLSTISAFQRPVFFRSH
jgi:hypothetical protein